jgi:hypothetical protein
MNTLANMKSRYTKEQIANDINLWSYLFLSDESFESLSFENRVKVLEIFGL